MKRLVDLTRGQEAGTCPWAFVDDMQTREPDLATPELIRLSEKLLSRIPEQWRQEGERLGAILGDRGEIILGVSDVVSDGDQFVLSGKLRKATGDPLSYHQIVVMDEDPVEDDYLGCVITDRLGRFELSFSVWSFRDIPVVGERLPDIQLKISEIVDDGFVLRATTRPGSGSLKRTQDGRTHIRLDDVVPEI